MPPVTRSLLIANVAVFLLQQLMGPELIQWFALWPLGTSYIDVPHFQIWQLLTYGFLHGSLLHIGFNMLALYMFGGDIERLFGPRFFLRYYLACVVTGGLTHILYTSLVGAPPFPTIGASAGMFGILLAFGWFFPRRMVMLIIPPIPMPARVFVVLYGALELFFGVTGMGAGIAHFAHLGGMLGGWLMIQHRRGRFPFGPLR